MGACRLLLDCSHVFLPRQSRNNLGEESKPDARRLKSANRNLAWQDGGGLERRHKLLSSAMEPMGLTPLPPANSQQNLRLAGVTKKCPEFFIPQSPPPLPAFGMGGWAAKTRSLNKLSELRRCG